VVEGIQIDAAKRDSCRVDDQQLAPHLFLGRVQADDDDGVRVHGCLELEYRKLRCVRCLTVAEFPGV